MSPVWFFFSVDIDYMFFSGLAVFLINIFLIFF